MSAQDAAQDAPQAAGAGARARVLMYCTASCPYCRSAERLFAGLGVADIERVRVDLEPQRRAEMMQASGRRTVPQIWIGAQHVGGFDDLYELQLAGELDALLAAAAARDAAPGPAAP